MKAIVIHRASHNKTTMKSRLPRVLLVLMALAGAAGAAAVYVGPDRAREAWRSLQAAISPSSSTPAGRSAGDQLTARPEPLPRASAESRLEEPPAPPAEGKRLIPRASGRQAAVIKSAGPASVPVGAPAPVPAPAAAADPAVAQAPARRDAKAEPISKERPAAVTLAAAAFEFPADDAGRLLADKLTPPREVPLSPTPFVREPRPRPSGMPDDLKRDVAKLPPAGSGAATVVVGDERRSPQRGEPALDRPPLAAEADPARPQRLLWPAAPLAYVSSANPDETPALRYVGLPTTEAVTPQEDPTADSTRAALLAGRSVPMPVPPPPLRLTIPDPFENARVVELANPPAERDPPEPSFQRPQPPSLPMAEMPKKKP